MALLAIEFGFIVVPMTALALCGAALLLLRR